MKTMPFQAFFGVFEQKLRRFAEFGKGFPAVSCASV